MTYILSDYCQLLEIRIDYLFRPRNDYHILLKKSNITKVCYKINGRYTIEHASY